MIEQVSTVKWKRNIGLLFAVLLGVIVIIVASVLKKPPQTTPAGERAVKVRSMTVPLLNVIPRSIGYGRVAPEKSWDAVAEIAGQVVWIADELRDGRVVEAETELLHIDDDNYRLILMQAEAQLTASLVKKKTTSDSLAIAKKDHALIETEYQRQKKLATQGSISKTALDNTERQLLASQTQLKYLQNSLTLISAEQQSLVAQRDAAKLDLKRTKVQAPFTARITQVNISTSQYANKGQLMFKADGLEMAEIEAQFSVGVLRPLVRNLGDDGTDNVRAGATQLYATVRLETADHQVEWPAKVDRVAGSIDPLTQTLGVIVQVEHPYALARPGERPPLLRDTFVEVVLSSPSARKRLIVPRNAIHNSHLYVINSESRLEKRKVKIEFAQPGYSVISQGISEGEQIVSSELVAAVNGMLLSPVEDKQGRQRMEAAASGKGRQP